MSSHRHSIKHFSGRGQPSRKNSILTRILRGLTRTRRLLQFFGPDRLPFVQQRAYCPLDNQPDQLFRRVVAAASLAGKDVGPDRGKVVGIGNHRVFKQSLVDRAELLHRKVAVVDTQSPLALGAARQRIDYQRHDRVGQPRPVEQFMPDRTEQTTICASALSRGRSQRFASTTASPWLFLWGQIYGAADVLARAIADGVARCALYTRLPGTRHLR